MEEEKKNKGSKVVIILLVLIILGMGGYISYDKYFYKYFKKPEVNEVKKEDKKEEKVEVNALEKDSITKLVNILINNDLYGDDSKTSEIILKDQLYQGAEPLFNTTKRVANSEVPDDYKLYSILTNADIEECNNNCSDGDCSVCLKEEVDNIFKKIYGSTPKENIKLNNSCPGQLEVVNLEYKNGNDAPYYKVYSGCGDAGYNRTETYIYDITKKDKEYYAYVAVGYISFSDARDNGDEDNAYFYTNLEKDKYTGNTDNFEVNESNYKEFSKYRITFKEDSNGNYIFKDSVRIEK